MLSPDSKTATLDNDSPFVGLTCINYPTDVEKIGYQTDADVQELIKEYPGKVVSSHRQLRFERATRLLAMFVRSHRSLRSLAPQHFASLRSLRSLAPFTGSLTHFAHSLMGQC